MEYSLAYQFIFLLLKVSDYEAVHSVRHWKDIKHRVGPYRRVFVFTHRTMPREPIVITHCALTSSPSNDVRVSDAIIYNYKIIIWLL